MLATTLTVHDGDELTWVASGSSAIRIDGVTWSVDTETALWIPAGVEHEVLPREDSLVFPLPIGIVDAPDLVRRTAPVRRTAELDRLCRELLQPGLSEHRDPEPVRAQVRELLPSLITAAAALCLPHDDRARQVAEALLTEPHSARSLEEWAALVHTSAKTLQRSFRAETGMTFPQWRSAARLSAALPLLERGVPVTSVAARVGYSAPTAFIDAFRRRYGHSPARHRRRVLR
ncbi:AraC family transcriptional regulator [Schumannella sp. 10F1B-5-1]|uniref:AraC family transcriptional regulator n=1 Tax=Schumannella sp. 10F1B-5-1 TaxID=2590780 RepID=UPI001130920C|nr:AraC family transcriptional regulator [Schumannella sp. 10F1B-5-1]TPW72335.1 helix-turn-helix transcriptional regulator [Schumannella sp. 10F1B-5-1]